MIKKPIQTAAALCVCELKTPWGGGKKAASEGDWRL